MTQHDQVRAERAAKCDRNNRESLLDAIGGLQSTDDPSLVPLHDELQDALRKLDASHAPPQTDHDADYAEFERLIAERVAAARGPLFTTDATGLFEAYLAGIPGETQKVKETSVAQEDGSWKDHATYEHSGPRKHYDCRCCRRFVERYGGLVTIQEDGTLRSPIWAARSADYLEVGNATPEFFMRSVCNITALIFKAKVTGVFVNGEAVWGTPSNVAGPGSKCEGTRWSHLHGTTHESLWKYASPNCIQTAAQRSAELLQDYITLKRALSEIPMEAAAQAVRVLEHGDAVDRAEKVLGVAKWFYELHQRLGTVPAQNSGRNHRRVYDNLVWLTVATAPPGWCHVRSTMIGTLLADIVEGLDFRTIKRRWDAKVPLAYQRPTAAPTDGQIEAANKLMEKLGAEGALARRYATLDDVLEFEWREPQKCKCQSCGCEIPGPVMGTAALCDTCGGTSKKAGGAFDHLRQKSKGVRAVDLPPREMRWDEFRRDVLPRARTVEVQLGGTMPFCGLVTAVNRDAPAMLQWDGLERTLGELADSNAPAMFPRNPTSWYFWHGGSTPEQWGLTPPERDGNLRMFRQPNWWQPVSAVFLPPHEWQQPEKFAHQPRHVHFAIAAARDSRKAGGGYFPETLRSEYHGIRAVIERHSRESELAGREAGNANGVALTKDGSLIVRVDGAEVYRLTL